ncbi:MAG: GTP-binding protein [Planctomycetota bacterium]
MDVPVTRTIPIAERLPLCLVTGFLGSGKTTLLGQVAREQTGQRLVFLVNEVAARDVDGQTLRGDVRPPARVVPVPGGSIFCTCLATKFIEVLGRIAYDHAARPLDGLVVEASGVADPRALRKLLRETGLDQRIELRRVISVLDPGTLPRLIRTLPNMAAQIEAADTVLLNKTDLFSAEETLAASQLVGELNSRAQLILAAHGLPLPGIFTPAQGNTTEGDLIGCQDPRFGKAVFEQTGLLREDQIRDVIQHAGEGLYRAKGTVRDDSSSLHVDYSSGHVRIDRTEATLQRPGLVVIASPDTLPRVLESLCVAQSPDASLTIGAEP